MEKEKRRIFLTLRSFSQIFSSFTFFERFTVNWQKESGLNDSESQAIINRTIELFDFTFPQKKQPHGQLSLLNIYRADEKVIIIVIWTHDPKKVPSKKSYDFFEVLEEEQQIIIAFWNTTAKHLSNSQNSSL